MKDMELMGLRELTDAEVGYLMTTRNYAGALILKFLAMGKDAAALDLHDDSEAENLRGNIRKAVSGAGLTRSLQAYAQGKTVILAKVRYGEDLKLTKEQEAALR
jgi:hypothetical protein